MKYKRQLEQQLKETLDRGKSVLLLGPRQTGKTTLISDFKADFSINLMLPSIRREYEADPALLERQLDAMYSGERLLVVIDEVQKIPELLDIAQVYIDTKKAQFILSGSSAKKLREKGINLLPGRVVTLRLDPLMIDELGQGIPELEDMLYFGMLPEIRSNKNDKQRELDLVSYVDTYLEDEIRAEALVRELGPFYRFLELICAESNSLINVSKLSKGVGIGSKTIREYLQILDDCLIAERIEPVSAGSKRRQLIKSNRYLIYDQGVRRVAAKEGMPLPADYLGRLFEQFIGQQLIAQLRLLAPLAQVKFWRDSTSGLEVDWVIEVNKKFIPIEVKLTKQPQKHDCRHLDTFIAEYPCLKGGLLVCQTRLPQKFSEEVQAINWRDLYQVISNLLAI